MPDFLFISELLLIMESTPHILEVTAVVHRRTTAADFHIDFNQGLSPVAPTITILLLPLESKSWVSSSLGGSHGVQGVVGVVGGFGVFGLSPPSQSTRWFKHNSSRSLSRANRFTSEATSFNATYKYLKSPCIACKDTWAASKCSLHLFSWNRNSVLFILVDAIVMLEVNTYRKWKGGDFPCYLSSYKPLAGS